MAIRRNAGAAGAMREDNSRSHRGGGAPRRYTIDSSTASQCGDAADLSGTSPPEERPNVCLSVRESMEQVPKERCGAEDEDTVAYLAQRKISGIVLTNSATIQLLLKPV